MIWTALERGDVAEAKGYRREFEDLFRLLDDLGWEEDNPEPRSSYPLTMPADQLERTVIRLRQQAEEALTGLAPHFGPHPESSAEGNDRWEKLSHEVADRFLDVRSACEDVLRKLGRI